MLKSKKNVFWEALVITFAIFIAGLFLGMVIESRNSEKISNFYSYSEINLIDGLTLSQLDLVESDCGTLKEKNIEFANRIYEEALTLEQYEEAGKLTGSLKILHRKYDLLRTLAWISNSNTLEKCQNYDLVIYLYEYDNKDVSNQAKQRVWSRILMDLKKDTEELVLIPLAVDQDLISLSLILDEYKIDSFPAIIINDKHILTELEGLDSIKNLL